ncbi:MAG: NUDIX hydrolase [Pseudomonadota bacterium]
MSKAPPQVPDRLSLTEAEDPWLTWAREVQSIGQSGLHWQRDEFDKERYEQLLAISADMMAALADGTPPPFKRIFLEQTGHATPKVDIRGVVFRDDKVLLVKEILDGCWSMPGGFADVGRSAAEVVVKELAEESGFQVRADRLLAVYDRARHGHSHSAFHMYKLFFACEIIGGEATGGMETTEVDFFDLDNLPELSAGRITVRQIHRMHELYYDPAAPTEFD